MNDFNLSNYLQSTRHLVGLGLALAGVAAHLLGYLNALWIPIVIGLYVFGVLVTPKTRVDLKIEALSDQSELRAELQAFLRRIRGRVPPEMYTRIESIEARLEDLLPRLHELEQGGDMNAFTIRQVITDYLPETFQNYLKLPRRYASTHVLPDGRTPDAVLLGQLELLERTLDEVTVSVAEGDTTQMLANGRFLRDKFGSADLGAGDLKL